MSETQKKPLTLKGILALIGAGLLYLIAQITGIDLTGGKGAQDPTTADGRPGVEAPADPAPKSEPKAPAAKPEAPKADPKPEPKPKAETKPSAPLPDDTAKIRQLFTGMRSGVHVEAEGRIVHILPDDNHGSRHQLFLCDLSNGLTLKISHNIDIAPYIPVQKGDTVRFRGDYEYNDKGGVVHWTHRNTRGGSHPHGWIKHKGKTYE